MLPLLILLKVLEPYQLTDQLALFLAPVMAVLDLPAYSAIVWASTLLGNLYTGMAVLASFWHTAPMDMLQVSTLALMMLLAHNLLVECAIAHQAGINGLFVALWRLLSAVLMAWITIKIGHAYGLGQMPAHFLMPAIPLHVPMLQWLQTQATLFVQIFLIIFAMVLVLDVLKRSKLEDKIHRLIAPVLGWFKLQKNAANISVVGLVIGIAYGGGLLLKDLKERRVTRQQSAMVMSILALNHAVIEDTLLMMIIGAHLVVILLVRLLLGLLLSWLLIRLAFACGVWRSEEA